MSCPVFLPLPIRKTDESLDSGAPLPAPPSPCESIGGPNVGGEDTMQSSGAMRPISRRFAV